MIKRLLSKIASLFKGNKKQQIHPNGNNSTRNKTTKDKSHKNKQKPLVNTSSFANTKSEPTLQRAESDLNTPTQQAQRLRVVFDILDSNHDGKLNGEEISNFIKSVYKYSNITPNFLPCEIESKMNEVTFMQFVRLLHSSDEDSPGSELFTKLSAEEEGSNKELIKTDSMSAVLPFAAQVKWKEAELKEAFTQIFDVNRDGVITSSEFKKVSSSIGLENLLSDDEIKHLFKSVSENGTLNFQQFAKLSC